MQECDLENRYHEETMRPAQFLSTYVKSINGSVENETRILETLHLSEIHRDFDKSQSYFSKTSRDPL